MAAASPVLALQEEATCPICLGYYTDPVITKCGHNFCRSCISACPAGVAGATLPCPQCRELCPQGELRANRQLQSIVQLVKQLSAKRKRPLQEEEEEDVCAKHEERLKLFCETDGKLICVVCRESSDHEQHKVRPTEEAAPSYKRVLQNRLKPLKDHLGTVVQCQLKEENMFTTLKSKLKSQRGKIATEFEGFRQLLNEQEQTLLRRIEEVENVISISEQLKMATLSAEMTSLEDLMREIEKKCEQPVGQFLKDIGKTLRRCEDLIGPAPEQVRKRYKELITLDADTAHHCFSMSKCGRRLTRTDGEQYPPDNLKRFTHSPCVLGREGFTSGRHYWELQLTQDNGWNIGVALESVSRKSEVTQTPERGVWVVQGYKGYYWALTTPNTRLIPSQRPLKLGVYLDCAGGRLSVFDADTLEELHTFTGAAFTERVYPYFSLWPSTDLLLM